MFFVLIFVCAIALQTRSDTPLGEGTKNLNRCVLVSPHFITMKRMALASPLSCYN